jgi:hypothetical protein
MSGQRQDTPRQKSDREQERRARLGRALRANLLKRKVQAKERAPSAKDGDEGRQR